MDFKDLKTAGIIPNGELVRIKLREKDEHTVYHTLFNDCFQKVDSKLYDKIKHYKVINIRSSFDFKRSCSALNIYLK